MNKLLVAPILFTLLLSLSACTEETTDITATSDKTLEVNDTSKTNIATAEDMTPEKTTPDTTSFDSCDLLSTSDIQEIFPDATITITQHGDSANPVGQRICFYSASDTEMKFAQTSLIRTKDMSSGLISSGQNAKTTFENSKELVDGAEDISGIGSQAYYGGSGLTLGAGLNVLVDDNTSLTVTVGLGFGNEDSDAHLTAEKLLAEKVISNL